MRYRILGPLEILRDDGRLVQLGGPRPDKVMAALLLEANRVVSVERLVDVLWDEDPPEGAIKQVRNCVSMIRAALRDAASPSLVTRTGAAGYRLTAQDHELDLLVFRALLDEAAHQVRNGAPDTAAGTLCQALSLWRGPVLSGMRSDALQPAAAHLTEERLHALDQFAELELRLGRHEQLIGLLAELATEYPLREQIVAHLMLALYRSGRCADALAAYRQLYARLDADLGIEPGRPVASLHDRMLCADPALLEIAVPEPATRAVGTVRLEVVPRQLPAAVRHFAGRTDELKRLDELPGAAGTVVISAISGTAGVGKTALAVYWAHAIADRFPDGQLYVNMRGFDPAAAPMGPGEALRRFLDALHVPPGRVPAEPDAAAALYRSMVAGKQVLVVLDNVRDDGQARPLLPGSPGCLAIVTSRHQLSGLVAVEGASLLRLDVLTDEEAADLLTARLGSDRTAAEPAAMTELIRLCARLPLALAITAARGAAQPKLRLAHLVTELADASGRLDVLDAGDTAASVRGVLSWSYRNLKDRDARMFRLLGLHPGPDISVPAAASLAAMPPAEARGALRDLVWANLLSEQVPGRYAFHDLLRAYAAEQAADHDGAQGCRDAVRRVLDHYVFTAQAASTRLNPTRPVLAGPTACHGALPEPIDDERQALAWFQAEHRVLLAAITLAHQMHDPHAWQLAWTMGPYLCRSGHWQDWADASQAALQTAQQLGDLGGIASARHGIGIASQRLGFSDQARANLLTAAGLFRDCGETSGEARAYYDLAYAVLSEGDAAQAVRYLRCAEDLYRGVGHEAGQAVALAGLGWVLAQAGHPEDAIPACQQALSLHRENGNSTGEAYTWHSLGYAQHQLGRYHEALASYRRTAKLCQEVGERYYTATALTGCGDACHALGDPEAATTTWRQALAILDELQHPDAGQLRDKLAQQ